MEYNRGIRKIDLYYLEDSYLSLKEKFRLEKSCRSSLVKSIVICFNYGDIESLYNNFVDYLLKNIAKYEENDIYLAMDAIPVEIHEKLKNFSKNIL